MNGTPTSPLTPSTMKIGGFYNWKNQQERLIYLGVNGCWHQFCKIDDPRQVWCEVLDRDLSMFEETAAVDPILASGEQVQIGSFVFGPNGYTFNRDAGIIIVHAPTGGRRTNLPVDSCIGTGAEGCRLAAEALLCFSLEVRRHESLTHQIQYGPQRKGRGGKLKRW
jgi:hypothetical protein